MNNFKKNVFKLVEEIFEKENVSFDGWSIFEVPYDEPDGKVIIVHKEINDDIIEASIWVRPDGSIELCLYDEETAEDIQYNTLQEIIDKQMKI